jgi:hypothetical protein
LESCLLCGRRIKEMPLGEVWSDATSSSKNIQPPSMTAVLGRSALFKFTILQISQGERGLPWVQRSSFPIPISIQSRKYEVYNS